MKAQIKPRIETENRTRLEEVIPLSTPYLVFLDPSDVCNFQCKFCPTGDRALIRSIRRPQLMPWELYKKIIDDLASMPEPIKTLRLYKDGEPLLNPDLPAMIRYAKESGRFLQVDTTSNGSLLTPWLNRRLIQAGLNKIFISINGLDETAYWNFARYKIKFPKLVKALRHLYKHKENMQVYVKIIGDDLSEEETKKFFDTFGDISDNIYVEHIAPCWPRFDVPGANNEVGIYGQTIKEVNVCPYIFYSLSINSNGTVSLCFLDWSRTALLGDLNYQSFKEIWEGKLLRDYRILHLAQGRSLITGCNICGQLSHGNPDDIDNHAEDILRRIK